MFWSSLLLAMRAIRRNLMRSFLTILGIVIGVSAVITMVTIGNGATQVVSDQIASLCSNLLMVRPGQRFARSSSSAPNFRIDDAAAIAAEINGLSAVAPVAAKATGRAAPAATPSPRPTTAPTATPAASRGSRPRCGRASIRWSIPTSSMPCTARRRPG